MSQPPKIMISGGGTGGHIFPAIAIANALQRRKPGTEILFIGASGRMEMEKVPSAGYRIEGLPIAGIQRTMSAKNLLLPFKILRSLYKARNLLHSFRPDAVAGVGGYASGPMLFAASRKGIPTLIQEQNSYAGITNKILGKRVNRICVAYEGMERFFPPEKILITGNPVRHSMIGVQQKRDEAYRHFGLEPARGVLLVAGGSLGARSINEAVKNGIGSLWNAGISVIWQTGKSGYEACALAARDYAARFRIQAFVERMELAYAAADVVIARAGALTISELCVTAKAAILVPSPHVAEDHQTRNARVLADRHAALLVPDAEAPERLVHEALELMGNGEKRKGLEAKMARLAKPDADERIAEEIIHLAMNN